MRCASRTAAAAIDTDCVPISVVDRTSLATAKVRWNRWFSISPRPPAWRARRSACFICPGSAARPAPWNRVRWPPGTHDAPHCPAAVRSCAAATRRDRAAFRRDELLQRVLREFRLFGRAIELGAVAGRNDRRFGDAANGWSCQALAQAPDDVAHFLGHKGNPLAHGERGGRVIESEREQLHQKRRTGDLLKTLFRATDYRRRLQAKHLIQIVSANWASAPHRSIRSPCPGPGRPRSSLRTG
jgi:hypothetical protein